MATDSSDMRTTEEEAEALVSRLLSVTGAAFEERGQLEHALHTRIIIEQAKGILAERFAVGVEDAFMILREAARRNRIKIHSLAAAVVESRDTPPEISAALKRGRGR